MLFWFWRKILALLTELQMAQYSQSRCLMSMCQMHLKEAYWGLLLQRAIKASLMFFYTIPNQKAKMAGMNAMYPLIVNLEMILSETDSIGMIWCQINWSTLNSC